MICKKYNTKECYNYRFINDGLVELENGNGLQTIEYEQWIDEYYVINKYESLKF